MTDEQHTSSSAARLVLYWTVVGIPLAWGIWTTVLKLKALFG
jgi:hypothetical protein